MPTGDKHVAALDGVRGVAVLLVLAVHFFGWDRTGIGLVDFFYRMASAGWIGVDLFFVLSGFLITGILAQARGKPRFFTNFYVRRAVRILPLYYGFIAAGSLYTASHSHQENVQGFVHSQFWLWTYLANIPAAIANKVSPIGAGPLAYNVFWSLAVEEQFYLVWPVVVAICPPERLLRLCLGLLVGFSAFRIGYVFHTGRTVTAYHGTPFRLDGLFIGSACAVMMRQRAIVDRFRRNVWLLTGLAASVIVGGYVIAKWELESRIVGGPGYLLLAVAGAAIIVACYAAPPGHPVRRFMELRVLRFFGKYSYGLYAWHETVINLTYPAVFNFAHDRFHSVTAGGLAAKAVGAAASVAIAYGSWHVYEKHFLRLKRFFAYPQLPKPAITVPPAAQSSPISAG